MKTSTDVHDDAPLRRADMATGTLLLRKRSTSGAVLPNKQPANNFLDAAVIEHFKTKAGQRGVQTLVNEALKRSMQAEILESVIRKTIGKRCGSGRCVIAMTPPARAPHLCH